MRLTPENYHSREANAAYLSSHTFTAWLECPAREAARAAGEWEDEDTTALLVGRYVDVACTGTGPEFAAFVEENRDAILTRAGKPKADFERADAMIARLKADPYAAKFLSFESQRIITFDFNGIPFRAMIDLACYEGECPILCDLKTTRTLEDVWDEVAGRNRKLHWYERYARQMAIYRYGFTEVVGAEPHVYLLAVDKTPPHPPAVISMNGNEARAAMEREMQIVWESAPLVAALRDGTEERRPCGRCSWCRTTQPIRVIEYEDRRGFYEAKEEGWL